MKSIELDKSETHRITYHEHDPSSDRIVLCFGFDGHGNMGPRGFGSDFCDRNGWNHVYIGPSKGTYFRDLPADRFMEKLQDVLSNRTSVAYGTSLGGFAALWYGSHANARILASSPRNPGHGLINAGPSGKLPAPLNGMLADAPRAAANPVVIYDRTQRKDHIMVKHWLQPAYPDAQIIHIPNSGHQAMDRLKQAGVLSRFVRAFVQGEPLEAKDTYFLEGTLGWHQDMAALMLQRKQFSEAREMLWAAVQRTPEMAGPLMQWLIVATAASPSPSVERHIAAAVAAGSIAPQRFRGQTQLQLKTILGRVA